VRPNATIRGTVLLLGFLLGAGTLALPRDADSATPAATLQEETAGAPIKGNDDFDDAIDIPEPLPYSNTQNTTAATTQPNEPTFCVPDRSVWYKFSPSTEVAIIARTTSSSYDPVVSVYRLGPGGSLIFTACNSTPAIEASAGQDYYFRIGDPLGQGGTLTFELDVAPDTDGDGEADPFDSDDDDDGFTDETEEQYGSDPLDPDSVPEATIPNEGSCEDLLDNDLDGLIDDDDPSCDYDSDGLPDRHDNCFTVPNPDQSDIDDDGLGDVCDSEADGDIYPNVIEDVYGSDPLDPDSVPEHNGPTAGSCADGEDNDADGLIDAADPSCSSAGPPVESPGLDFSMGIDVDGDTNDDCANSGPTAKTCSIPADARFQLRLYLNSLPDGFSSYEAFDLVLVRFGVTSVIEAGLPVADANPWPACVFEAISPPSPPISPNVLGLGCVIGLPPAGPSSYTGLIATADFLCTESGQVAMVHHRYGWTALLPSIIAGYQAEANWKLESLAIECKESLPPPVPPPAVGGFSRDAAEEDAAVRSAGGDAGSWPIAVLALTGLAAVLTIAPRFATRRR
jgi:hypothetical protein